MRRCCDNFERSVLWNIKHLEILFLPQTLTWLQLLPDCNLVFSLNKTYFIRAGERGSEDWSNRLFSIWNHYSRGGEARQGRGLEEDSVMRGMYQVQKLWPTNKDLNINFARHLISISRLELLWRWQAIVSRRWLLSALTITVLGPPGNSKLYSALH